MKNVLVSSRFPTGGKSFLFRKFEGVQLPKKGTFLSNCARQSKSGRVGAGEGVTQKTSYGGRGGSGPRSNLLPWNIPFLKEKVPLSFNPFRISSIDKWYPFHIPRSEFGIPFNCFKCTVLKILINHTPEPVF